MTIETHNIINSQVIYTVFTPSWYDGSVQSAFNKIQHTKKNTIINKEQKNEKMRAKQPSASQSIFVFHFSPVYGIFIQIMFTQTLLYKINTADSIPRQHTQTAHHRQWQQPVRCPAPAADTAVVSCHAQSTIHFQ